MGNISWNILRVDVCRLMRSRSRSDG